MTVDLQARRPGTVPSRVIRVRPGYAQRLVVTTEVRRAPRFGQPRATVSTIFQMRFDARRSPSLPDEVSARLQKLAGSRLTRDGVLLVGDPAEFERFERFRDPASQATIPDPGAPATQAPQVTQRNCFSAVTRANH